VRRERFGAHACVAADRVERSSRPLARRDGAERQRVRKRLAPVGERSLDDALHSRRDAGLTAAKRDQRRVDVRAGPEHLARDGVEACALRDELHENRDGAVRFRAGLREEAVGDLALHHHAPRADRRRAVEALDDEGRRDVVRQVRDELGRRRRERRRVERERILPVERRSLDPLQPWLEAAIELDGVDVRDARREVARQHAEARPDLEHDVVPFQLREPADDAEDVLVDEEVLPERLFGRDAHSWNATVAFASIMRPSSAASSPRAAASASTVCTTFAGSLRLPRTGCGAR
jgi:hypothetical protein